MAKENRQAQLLALGQRTLRALPASIYELGTIFADAGHELALVGGPVRDAFLGLPIHDFDFTTSACPEETEALLSSWGSTTWDIGKEFGTIGAHKHGLNVEVTTYRSDVYDPHSRKPEVTFGRTLEGDLTRRDFTVNAMAVRLPSLELVDPCGGLNDLVAGVLRTPISPEQSFDDDPLRIMRAARFCAQLGFDVSEETMKAMRDMAERLGIVSAERIGAEFSRLVTSPYPRRGIEIMVYTGVAEYVVPEVALLQETVDAQHRHKDVYEHTLTVFEQVISMEDAPEADATTRENAVSNEKSGEKKPSSITHHSLTQEAALGGPLPGPDLTLRLAALFHDIGKPATRKFEKDGTVSFRWHDVVGAKLTRKRLRALRFDKQTESDVARLVELHLRAFGFSEGEWTDSAVRRFVRDAGPLLSRLLRLIRADITSQNASKVRRLRRACDRLSERIVAIAQQEELDAIRPDLDGRQIMEILNLPPGKDVGRARQFLLDLRLDEGPMSQEEATARLLEWWNAQ